jgi:DNA-directed RNA polymerase subunit F
MDIYASTDETILIQTDTYYEEQASQEEVYLEETEEELRMILCADDSPSPQSECVNEEQGEAVEELITGDADDAPLSEQTVREILDICPD